MLHSAQVARLLHRSAKLPSFRNSAISSPTKSAHLNFSLSLPLPLSLRRQRLDIPNALRILQNAAIAAKEAHAAHALDALAHPLVLVLERLVDQGLGLDVGIEVVADEVVVAMVEDAVDQRAELASVAKDVGLDGIEDLLERGVDGVAAVVVVVAQVLDALGQVAEEKDIRVADFAGNFNL